MPGVSAEVDVLDTKRQQCQKNNHSFLLVPGNIVDDRQIVDIVEPKTSFNFSAITARE